MKLRLLVVLSATATLTAVGCSVSTGPDQAGLEYNAGPVSSVSFDSCIPPGQRAYHGPGDNGYVYPAGQRTFQFSEGAGSDVKPITVVSKDNLEMTSSGVATFSLNTDCKTLRQFHERIGLKYKAYTDEGWAKMLHTYLKQPLDRAMDAASKQFAWKNLYANPEAKQQWENLVGRYAVQFVNEQAGGDFFCSPSYTGKGSCGQFNLTLQQPQPPTKVRDALASAQEAVERNAAQRNENERVKTELESIKELVDVLGPQGYVMYEAIKSGKIDVVPVPAGGAVNLTPKG